MATWMEVSTTDVVGTRLTPRRAEVALDGSAAGKPLQPGGSSSVFEGDITGASQVQLTVEVDGFWTVTQHFELTAGNPPVVEPSGRFATYNPYDYEINLDPPVVHTRGAGDWGVTVNVRMSHLRDAEKKAREILKRAHDVGWAQRWDTAMDFDVSTAFTTKLVGRWCLGPEGATGQDRLNMREDTSSPGGTVYFFERTSAPRLIIVWQPGFLTLEDLWYEETRVPLHYNLFFHPLIHWSDHPPGEEAYPWNFDSLNLPHRYLMGKPPTAAQPSPTQLDILRLKSKNKDMLKQLAGAEAPTIFVFPVGNAARWLRDIVAQKAALELLQEINHFLQRRAANELALHPIGRITVSGFSFGYHGPVGLMDDTPVPGFDDNWVEVYNFDGNEAGFVDPTRRWLQKRIGDRRVRIYTQSGIWLSLASRPPLSQALKISRFHATEIQSYAGTILHVPSQFWFDNFRVTNFDAIHQVIPALFLHSAAAGWFLV